jgi:hypothetical protein
MENEICNFEIIYNPNRKYASTVNLVFFRAVPLTKNFQKYIDGLANWKKYMKFYPDCQLQVFVDEHVMKDEKIQKLLQELNARIILFKCPEYIIKDNYHIGLFATMLRFYPIFDVNKHALKVAHIQELEPDEEFVPRFEYLDKLGTMNHGASMVYTSRKIYAKEFVSDKYTFEEGIHFPWIIAGRFSGYDKIPFKVFSDYLEDVKQGKKFYNVYEKWETHQKAEHGKYSFGVDEIFLNEAYLGYLINHGHTVGILIEYNISFPVTHHLDYEVKNHPNSPMFLGYILGKKAPVRELMKDFETLFEKNAKSERAEQCAKRFYDIVEKYPNWLGKYESSVILKFFKGYLERNCLILIKNGKVIDIKDL